MSITHEALNDLRRRVLDHEAKVAKGEAFPSDPPYTLEELKEALSQIEQVRRAIPSEGKKSKSTVVSLEDLL